MSALFYGQQVGTHSESEDPDDMETKVAVICQVASPLEFEAVTLAMVSSSGQSRCSRAAASCNRPAPAGCSSESMMDQSGARCCSTRGLVDIPREDSASPLLQLASRISYPVKLLKLHLCLDLDAAAIMVDQSTCVGLGPLGTKYIAVASCACLCIALSERQQQAHTATIRHCSGERIAHPWQPPRREWMDQRLVCLHAISTTSNQDRLYMMYLLTRGWSLAHTSLAMTPEHS